jgi:hypothetical protein
MSGGCACGCGSGGGPCVCACVEARLAPPSNRPGLAALSGRVGDYRDFFADAVRRLSDPSRPALRRLGTRELDDPTMALIDAWSIAADILTFYRERLANEGYLRTARDEYAIRELAALVGFTPRPGVAATAHLAYLMEKSAAPVDIAARARAQTVPGPGEQMQTFETNEPLHAEAPWSVMPARATRPAKITLVDAMLRPSLRLRDESLLVRPGERLLFVFGARIGLQVVREVEAVRVDVLQKIVELQLKKRLAVAAPLAAKLIGTLEKLRDRLDGDGRAAGVARQLVQFIGSFFLGGPAGDGATLVNNALGGLAGELKSIATELHVTFDALQHEIGEVALNRAAGSPLASILSGLGRQAVAQLASGRQLARDSSRGLAAGGGANLALLKVATPAIAAALPAAMNTLSVTPISPDVAPSVFLLRFTAGAFGAVAPPRFTRTGDPQELPLDERDTQAAFLDAVYEGIRTDSYVIVDQAAGTVPKAITTERLLRLARVRAAQTVARSGYNMSAKSTRLDLISPADPRQGVSIVPEGHDVDLSLLRNTLYHVQSEPVSLADSVDDSDVSGRRIELQDRVDGLEPGRWLVVTGERTDVTDVNGRPLAGLRAGELAMILAAHQAADANAPGDTLHTIVDLVTPLAYTYRRSTVRVYGNVVEASHGETVAETLGSGDAATPNQRFTLSRAPVTFTTAPTTSGVESSETVRVNHVRYHQVDALADAGPSARAYQMDLDADGSATLRFGDGVHAVRLPTGAQNVRVEYRVGIGSPGNVHAEQISLLTTRPLGVTGVTNPLGASGGADRDPPERIRRNAPLAARALSPLSRLVSVADYGHFARRFAGIGQAEAVKASDGAQPIVLVTVAGVDEAPLEPGGDLIVNLRAAYGSFGDPALPVEILVRELKVVVIQARVAIDPDLLWADVEPAIRLQLLTTFGPEVRRLGQPAYLSEAVAAIQATPGVSWTDVDRFGGLTETEVRDAARFAAAVTALDDAADVPAHLARVSPDWTAGSGAPRFLGAELVCMLTDIPDLIALNLVTGGAPHGR